MRSYSIVPLCGLLVACNESKSDPTASLRPSASNVAVRDNDLNGLSALVGFDSANLSSARVVVSGGGESAVTPTVPLVDGRQEVVVLGLLAETDYTQIGRAHV